MTRALAEGKNLRGSDLRGVCLQDTNCIGLEWDHIDLSFATIFDADFTDTSLVATCFRGATVRKTNFCRATLADADLVEADFIRCKLDDVAWQYADITGTRFCHCGLSKSAFDSAKTHAIKADFWFVLAQAIPEIPALRKALVQGQIDGQAYTGPCCCLVGTLTKAKGCLRTRFDSNQCRPAERFFMGIVEGDTPESNPVSALVLKWLDEFTALLAK